MSSDCLLGIIGITICLVPARTCVEGVFVHDPLAGLRLSVHSRIPSLEE